MQTRLLPMAAAALCWMGTTAALAQPNEAPSEVPGNEAYYFAHPCERPGPFDRLWWRRCNEWRSANAYPGAGPERDLHIGQHMPPALRRYQYQIDDWRGHRLIAPPHGYQWYQVGADYVLVELATGRIVQTRVAR